MDCGILQLVSWKYSPGNKIWKNIKTEIKIIEVGANINTPFFAEQATKELLGLMGTKENDIQSIEYINYKTE